MEVIFDMKTRRAARRGLACTLSRGFRSFRFYLIFPFCIVCWLLFSLSPRCHPAPPWIFFPPIPFLRYPRAQGTSRARTGFLWEITGITGELGRRTRIEKLNNLMRIMEIYFADGGEIARRFVDSIHILLYFKVNTLPKLNADLFFADLNKSAYSSLAGHEGDHIVERLKND